MVIKYRFVINGETFKGNTFEALTKLHNYHDIVYIYCEDNDLKVLPTLPNSLEYLYCSNNNITALPNLPNSLKYLYCYNNLLILLPILPNSLQNLICSNNLLTLLPKFGDSLKYNSYSCNPVETYIRDKCGGNLDIYHRVNEIFATKLVRWYLDCRENPMYKFCRDRLNREYDALMDDDVSGIMA